MDVELTTARDREGHSSSWRKFLCYFLLKEENPLVFCYHIGEKCYLSKQTTPVASLWGGVRTSRSFLQFHSNYGNFALQFSIDNKWKTATLRCQSFMKTSAWSLSVRQLRVVRRFCRWCINWFWMWFKTEEIWYLINTNLLVCWSLADYSCWLSERLVLHNHLKI